MYILYVHVQPYAINIHQPYQIFTTPNIKKCLEKKNIMLHFKNPLKSGSISQYKIKSREKIVREKWRNENYI